MAPDRRRGRRDNGLDATDWTAIDDLDPRVGEYLLEVLGARGIAAYLQPSMDVNPITRQTIVPSRPTDRLFVDRRQAEAARGFVRQILAEVERDRQLEAAFAGIVAGFDRPDPETRPWPAVEDLDPDAEPRDAEPARPAAEPLPAPAGPVDARHVTEPSLLEALDTFGADLPDEPQERFVPPPPPPLPRLSAQAVLGVLAIVAGLVVLLRPDLLPLGRSGGMLLGFGAILAGATALILRLRPGTDPDDLTPPDDGAQV